MGETNTTELGDEYPLLTLKNAVVFPGTIKPLFFRSSQSLRALEEAVSKDRDVFVVTMRNPEEEHLAQTDLYAVGVVGKVTRLQQLPNGAVQAVFSGEHRGRLLTSDLTGPFFRGNVEILHSIESQDSELQPLAEALKTEFFKHIEAERELSAFQWFSNLSTQNVPAGQFADAVASLVNADVEQHQEILETLDVKIRVERVYSLLVTEMQQKEFERDLKNRVQERIDKKQKEYFLNEQMKAIQNEMGADTQDNELEELAKKIEAAQMPTKVKEVADKELNKLKMMGNSYEATPVRNYLDWLISVPWHSKTEDNLSLGNAQEILDADHFGLDKIKERIVEYIAVANVVGSLNGPILCLVGPPGVGKTSLAQSIARALGRKFARISLGGVRDEAEIRGHRRTYIGALPGKLIQTMKKVETVNPVILLDEVDKLSHHYLGSPSAALLEVLDPEQNHTFMDHYLEVEYDLSQVLFICTANNLSEIPLPLQDRMEIIELSGYTELEKAQIAKRHLIPKQMEKNGVKDSQLIIPEEQLLHVIRSYTREAGVRSLERLFAKIGRKAITEKLKSSSEEAITLNEERVSKYLGPPVFQHNKIEAQNEVGSVTGLAWTSVGGETLSIEVTTMPGAGKVQLTGKLGDVMKESAQAAISYVRSNANSFGIYSKVFEKLDIHIHVPAGGTPKDGPSAGIALTSGIVSALTGIPVLRDVALTGEVTLRGKILPIGGLKEKLLAAKRVQIRKVLIPEENRKDLLEVPNEILEGLDIEPVAHVKEVIPSLLERLPIAVSDEDLEVAESAPRVEDEARFNVTTFAQVTRLNPTSSEPTS